MKHVPLTEDSALQRYEWIDDGRLVGFIDYYVFDQVCMVMHTEVSPALAGQGYGSRMASRAVEFIRALDKGIVPICGFFAHYLRKNPQHHMLVTAESRRIFSIGFQDNI
jgi:predicted GNAT family acetyltransferase